MNFADVVRRRRMVRSFTGEPIDASVIETCVDLALRSPSAGKSQGWSLVCLEGDDTARYWAVALPEAKRGSFAFAGLLRAPFMAIVTADPGAYLARYSEPDKAATGLGQELDAWPAPYWTVDASFATMTLLLALEDAGLGAVFFAHANEEELRREFAIPDSVQILGVVAVGHRAAEGDRPGRSASRPRRQVADVVRRGRW